MFLCFYSLLMRQERGVSGCVRWCDKLGVCWMRVSVRAGAQSHLAIRETCRVITESWPWRSGPRQGALYSWSFKGSRPTLIRHAQLLPPPHCYFFLCIPNARAPPDSVAAQASGAMLPGVMWSPGSEVLVGGEVQTEIPSDRTIWTSDPT